MPVLNSAKRVLENHRLREIGAKVMADLTRLAARHNRKADTDPIDNRVLDDLLERLMRELVEQREATRQTQGGAP